MGRRRRVHAHNERGVVLLLVLGILALLSLLAVAFVFEARVELRAAQNFENTMSADELATAGAQHGMRTLEVDKQRRTLGADGNLDTGDEQAFDSLIDLWRADFQAPIRIAYNNPTAAEEQSLRRGDLLQQFDAPGTTLESVGTVVGIDRTNDILNVVTELPQSWTAGKVLRQPGGAPTRFGNTTAVTIQPTPQIPSNDIDLNNDRDFQNTNAIDDDNDGTDDSTAPPNTDTDEGLDAVWQNFYDQAGALKGRYAVLVEDETAKANVNVAHNLGQQGEIVLVESVVGDTLTIRRASRHTIAKAHTAHSWRILGETTTVSGSALTVTGASLTLGAGEGALVTAGDFLIGSDPNNTPTDNGLSQNEGATPFEINLIEAAGAHGEVVQVTAVAGDNLTIVRGFNSTAAEAHALDADGFSWWVAFEDTNGDPINPMITVRATGALTATATTLTLAGGEGAAISVGDLLYDTKRSAAHKVVSFRHGLPRGNDDVTPLTFDTTFSEPAADVTHRNRVYLPGQGFGDTEPTAGGTARYSARATEDDDVSRARDADWLAATLFLGADGIDNNSNGCIDELGETGDTVFPGGTIVGDFGDGVDIDADGCIDELDEGPFATDLIDNDNDGFTDDFANDPDEFGFGPDMLDNDGDGCVDEFGEVGDTRYRQLLTDGVDNDGDTTVDEADESVIDVYYGDGIDNDGDGCIDERDEGVNEPREFNPRVPSRLQPQTTAGLQTFEEDEEDNDLDNDADGDGILGEVADDDCAANGGPGCDEANEGDDQPILALEDLITGDLLNLGASWLNGPVAYAGGGAMTARRNLLSISGQSPNTDRFERPRTNPNFATSDETAAAARAPFHRGFDSFREAEFATLQAAINLHDMRDKNHQRDEIADAAGNVFAGVEAVRINELMVAPRTDIFDAEGDFGGLVGTADLSEAHGLPPPFGGLPNGAWVVATGGGSGRPREGTGAVEGYITNSGATIAYEYSGAITFSLPAAAYFSALTDNDLTAPTGTDNDGDGVEGDDPAVDTDADGFADEEGIINGFDDDGDGTADDGVNPLSGDDPVEDDDGGPSGFVNEDGGFTAVVPPAVDDDRVFKLVMRARTNANAAPSLPAVDRGFMVFVNGVAVYPAPGGAAAPSRWGIPPNLAVNDGLWHIQEGICHLSPGNNTIRFLKPDQSGALAAVDDIDIDWFYFTLEPDGEWIELVNLGDQRVDVSDWTVQVDHVEDTDHTNLFTRVSRSIQFTIPQGTTLAPPDSAGVVQHTVLSVDGTGTTAGVPTPRGNAVLDVEAGDGSSPDLIAFDRIWDPPAAPHQLVELGGISSIFAPTPLAAPVPPSGTTDQLPSNEMLFSEPLDDTATGPVAALDPRNTPADLSDDLQTDIELAVVTLMDAMGNVVDRVTYDGTQYSDDDFLPTGAVVTDGLEGTIRGMRSLERINPVWAGETPVRETSTHGGTTTVDNFYAISYPGSAATAEEAQIGTPVRVLADGNYDNWFPNNIYVNYASTPAVGDPAPGFAGPSAVSDGVDATPGLPNDVDADGNPDPHTLARVKNGHLSSVGELRRVPYPRAATGMDATAINALFDDTVTADDRLRINDTVNIPRLEVATLTYDVDTNETALTAGAALTNATQGGTTRVILRANLVDNTLLVFDNNNDTPWVAGDRITAGIYTGNIVALRAPQPPDVAGLIDGYSVDALFLEAALAGSTVTAPWEDPTPAITPQTDDPQYFRIPITGAANLDLAWDEEDGITAGTYSLYLVGMAGARLTIDVLDSAGNPISALQRSLLEATEGDHLVSYGRITIPYDAGVGNGLRLRISNGGAAVGSPVTFNRVVRAILAPPQATLGRININTASDRLLRGLPGGETVITPGPPQVTVAELIVQDRRVNGPLTTVADPFGPGRAIAEALINNTVDDDEDGLTDEADEADLAADFLAPMANLISVRSDLYRILVLAQAVVDSNGDGIVQDAEVRAERKLEFVYGR